MALTLTTRAVKVPTLVDIPDDAFRVVEANSIVLSVNKRRVLKEATSLLELEPAQLDEIVRSGTQKRGPAVSDDVLNFSGLLHAVEVVANGKKHQELFLRATTTPSDGKAKARHGDTCHLFALHPKTMLAIKARLAADRYTTDEVDGLAAIQTFFDKYLGDEPPEEKDDVVVSYRLNATETSEGFTRSETFKATRVPTLADGPSIVGKKRLREAAQLELERLAGQFGVADVPGTNYQLVTLKKVAKLVKTDMVNEDGDVMLLVEKKV